MTYLNRDLKDIINIRCFRERDKLDANRLVVGTLRGFDQFMNLVLENTLKMNGNDKNDIGIVVIRGNNVVMIEAQNPCQRKKNLS
ncbi:hypothetical protein IFM89_031871, partial [Coptis chinensis]